jgi:hypothetical protein
MVTLPLKILSIEIYDGWDMVRVSAAVPETRGCSTGGRYLPIFTRIPPEIYMTLRRGRGEIPGHTN